MFLNQDVTNKKPRDNRIYRSAIAIFSTKLVDRTSNRE